MNEELKAHNAAVEAMFQQIKPIVEAHDSNVALDTLLITLAACGGQLDMPPEHFKAFVIVQLDRLMLVNAKPEGTA
jgi:predicted small lipoprotein YifL